MLANLLNITSDRVIDNKLITHVTERETDNARSHTCFRTNDGYGDIFLNDGLKQLWYCQEVRRRDYGEHVISKSNFRNL